MIVNISNCPTAQYCDINSLLSYLNTKKSGKVGIASLVRHGTPFHSPCGLSPASPQNLSPPFIQKTLHPPTERKGAVARPIRSFLLEHHAGIYRQLARMRSWSRTRDRPNAAPEKTPLICSINGHSHSNYHSLVPLPNSRDPSQCFPHAAHDSTAHPPARSASRSDLPDR